MTYAAASWTSEYLLNGSRQAGSFQNSRDLPDVLRGNLPFLHRRLTSSNSFCNLAYRGIPAGQYCKMRVAALWAGICLRCTRILLMAQLIPHPRNRYMLTLAQLW